MKQTIVFLCTFFLLTTLAAQSIKQNEVPAAVTHTFSFVYPDATRVSWQMQQDQFRADFRNDKKLTRAVFSGEGSLVWTKTEIKASALPKQALGFLIKDEPDTKIQEASIMEDDNGVITFKAVVDKTEFVFDHTGQYLVSNSLAANTQD
jgi:hypothetical protein